MYFKKLEIFFTFISFALLVFSSPIKYGKEKINNNSEAPTIVEVRNDYNLAKIASICERNINDDCINKVLNATGTLNTNTTRVSLPKLEANKMKGSTFSVPKKYSNGYYVGRNLDLNDDIEKIILVNYPKDHYSSVSTVIPDYNIIEKIGNETYTFTDKLSLVAPFLVTFDGLNEKGVSISVNMNQGKFTETKNSFKKFHLNVSFLMRIVLDFASSTDKAIDIIRGFELHNEYNFNIHFMISDATGKSVVVEYAMDKKEKYNKMIVTKSSIVTNFNIAKGKKPSLKEKKQYSIIKKMIKTTRNMDVNAVKKTLEAAKHNTQYSVIYDLNNRKAIYYVNENYQKEYKVQFDKNYDDSFPAKPEDEQKLNIVDVDVTKNIKKVEKAEFRVFEYEGDYGFNEFIKQGGALSEVDITKFIFKRNGFDYPFNDTDYKFPVNGNACSDFSVQNEDGNGYFFGRNYDFHNDNKTLAVITRPKGGYDSISTVDINIINSFGYGNDIEASVLSKTKYNDLPEEIFKEIAVYMPLDGFNEKGLSIAMNMVPVPDDIYSSADQKNKNKIDLTMTTLIRYLLDTTATVDEAIKKIKSINMHNHYVHFLISDATGKSVVIEYKSDKKTGGKMFVIKSPVMTNYFLADDEELKAYNFEILNNDRRYDTIIDRITKKPNHSLKDVRNTLRAAMQPNTIWSAAFDKAKKEATYFVDKDYSVGYRIKLKK